MEKYGILLQLLAGIIFGLDYIIPRRWLDKANCVLSRVLSFLSSKPSRAAKASLIVAFSLASLAVSLPMMIINYKELHMSSWEGIIGIILAAVLLAGLGGSAYIVSLNSIAKRVSKSHIRKGEHKQHATDTANVFLLISSIVLGSVSIMVVRVVGKSFPNLILVIVVIYLFLFLFPILIGSLFYLTARVSIWLLDKVGKTTKGALWPIALVLFICGGVILLIEAW